MARYIDDHSSLAFADRRRSYGLTKEAVVKKPDWYLYRENSFTNQNTIPTSRNRNLTCVVSEPELKRLAATIKEAG
ncbi:MAG TPA: hypothetical protein VGF75_01500 [Candidatus Saccharimonadales bacterium]|jgi:hypothetical protein